MSAAGNLDHEQFVALVAKHFEHVKPGKNGLHSPEPKTYSRINLRNKKSLEQVQICIGVPSHPIAHERRYASYILNTLLGGGMSSRLFQNIRERQGLAYSIYSDLNPYRDTGSMCVYAGTSRESAIKVVESVVEEFRNLKNTVVPEEELRRSKDQLKGTIDEFNGKVKEKVGQVTKNPNLAAEGQDQKIAGKVQKKVGQIEKVFEK